MQNGAIVGGIPRVLLSKETGCSLAGWVLFLTAASLYCLVYNQLVLVSPASFMDAFLWSLREYTGWLLVTPLLFFGLRRIHNRLAKHNPPVSALLQPYGLLGFTCLAATLIIRLAISQPPHSFTVATLVEVLPSHLRLLCLLTLLWHLFFRTTTTFPPAALPSPQRQEVTACDKVRVMKGNGEALIRWAEVDFISAAGNYMELICGAEKYLLRMPLKELEQLLPCQRFVRVHRSHIVNIDAIARIGAHPAGNGFIELRNQHLVPLSKGYKVALEQLAPMPSKSPLIPSSQASDTHPKADA